MSIASAAPVAAEAVTEEVARYLTFTLNGDAYGLNIFHVIEILECRNLTVVPMMPDFVRGVINLRGRAVPVIDLAIRFAQGITTIARRTSVIIVHLNHGGYGQHIGILVDSVSKVVAFGTYDIEPPPVFGAGIRADFIAGMAKQDNDFIVVLDINQVLSVHDLIGIDGSMTQPPATTRSVQVNGLADPLGRSLVAGD
jgi:purine-binding chemotaxis protein CheW